MDILPSLEVVIGDPRPPPECPHGPTLLFRRFMEGEERLFYACSACRERKGCHFFLWANEKFDDSKKQIWELERQKILPAIDHKKLYVKLMKLLQSPNNRVYCHDCNELLSSNNAKKHLDHDIVDELTDYQITHPSELLKPLDNPKKEAQYLFSKKSTELMVSVLKNLGCKHILCIGAPRVHEYILSECSAHMDSVLLDIDHRYHQFHGPLQFCWYNVFNNHYFNKSASADVVNEFLQQDSGRGVAIVMDPPFGGRVEPLAHTVQQIINQHQSLNSSADSDLKVLWTFPYFMEPHLLRSLPEYKMLDYKVDYDNHPLFTQSPNGRKYGSPVRIFTNVSPKAIPLPEAEGYRFCKPCKRWVSAENKHCKKCSNCSSKDGQTYVHCSICNRCVKPSWAHCTTCQRCCIKGHKCGAPKPSNACFHCGEPGHKKADCKAGPKKRKIDETLENVDSKTKMLKIEKNDIPKKKKKMQTHEMSASGNPTKEKMNGSPEKEVKSKKVKLQKMNVKLEKEVVLKKEKLQRSGIADESPKKQKMNDTPQKMNGIPKKDMTLKKKKMQTHEMSASGNPTKEKMDGSPEKEVKSKKVKLHKMNAKLEKAIGLKKEKLQRSGIADESPKKQKMNGTPQKEVKLKKIKLQKMNGNPEKEVVLKKVKLQKSGRVDDSPKTQNLKNGKPKKEKKQILDNVKQGKIKKSVK